MMISPEVYKEENKDKELKELLVERNKLIKYMNEYENDSINNERKSDIGIIISPSPSTRYYWYNYYLKEITDLIIEKLDDNK
ncbi:MAG: hypothetical protein E7311_05875 [Clostridiales bacterium]|nr:hypothetical protein [Clostridiales bacterium]